MKSNWRMPVACALVLGLGACGAFKGGGRKTPVVGDRIPILVSESGAKVDDTISGLQVLLPPATANADWTQSGGSPDKAMERVALASSVSRAWSASVPAGSNRARLAAAPVIADGKLFVVDVNAMLRAYNAQTGAQLWTAPVAKDDNNKAARFGGGASYGGGRIYASDGLGDLVAFDANNGSEIWRVKPGTDTGAPLRGAPTVDVDNGQVYVLSQDNQLYAVSTADGSVKWNASGSLESQGVFGVAAPATARGTIVAGFSSGELNAYRYENGRGLWQDALSRTSMSTSVSSLADIDADPVIYDNRVYVLGQGGRMVAVDLASGQRLWEQNFAGISTPWVAGEWVFVVTDESKLYCLQRSTGKVRWVTQLRGFKVDKEKKKKGPLTWYGPVLAGDHLVLTNSLGQIAFVTPTDGTVAQTIDGGDSFALGPVVAGNTLYTLDQKGRLTAWR